MEAARHAYEAVGLRPAQRFPTRPFVTVTVVTEAGALGLKLLWILLPAPNTKAPAEQLKVQAINNPKPLNQKPLNP